MWLLPLSLKTPNSIIELAPVQTEAYTVHMTKNRLQDHYQIHRGNLERARYFEQYLANPELTGNHIVDVFDASAQYCAEAYYQHDIEGGDRFARVNIMAAERLAESPAARSAAVFLTAQTAEIAA